MNMKHVLCLLLLFVSCHMEAAELTKETHVFDITEDGDTLRLDRYPAAVGEGDNSGQVLIFAFGGGFRGGQRDHASFLPMFRFLVDNGITVVSTDYRTALGNMEPSSVDTPQKFNEALYEAIRIAVEDLYTATAFIVDHSEKWNIDPDKIIACGSSAGAITVLQAEYGICNGTVPPGLLPSGFNYSGVISMAGAVCAKGTPVWRAKPSPMLLFHGDADPVVPFEKAVIDDFGLWGSSWISACFESKSIPHRFHIVRGAGHEAAGTPMTKNRGEMLDFIRSLESSEANRIVVVDERTPGYGDYKTDFTIEDYLRSNL